MTRKNSAYWRKREVSQVEKFIRMEVCGKWIFGGNLFIVYTDAELYCCISETCVMLEPYRSYFDNLFNKSFKVRPEFGIWFCLLFNTNYVGMASTYLWTPVPISVDHYTVIYTLQCWNDNLGNVGKNLVFPKDLMSSTYQDHYLCKEEYLVKIHLLISWKATLKVFISFLGSDMLFFFFFLNFYVNCFLATERVGTIAGVMVMEVVW